MLGNETPSTLANVISSKPSQCYFTELMIFQKLFIYLICLRFETTAAALRESAAAHKLYIMLIWQRTSLNRGLYLSLSL